MPPPDGEPTAMADRLWRAARVDAQRELAAFREFMLSAQSPSTRDAENEVARERNDEEDASSNLPRTVVTDSGLRLEILREGTRGPRRFPGATSTVDVHYTGYLAGSGAVFDGSRSKVRGVCAPAPVHARRRPCRPLRSRRLGARRARARRCAFEWARGRS